MKNIDKMLKCRALFLQSVATLCGDNLTLDDNFNALFESFLHNYFQGNEKCFNLLFYFAKDENDNLIIKEEESWNEKLAEYLSYFSTGNTKKVKELYDDIGKNNIVKISILAEQFMEYIWILNDINNPDKIRIKS